MGSDSNQGWWIKYSLRSLFFEVPNRQVALLQPPFYTHPSCSPTSFLAWRRKSSFGPRFSGYYLWVTPKDVAMRSPAVLFNSRFSSYFPRVLLQIFYRVRNWLSSELLKITSLHIAISEDLWIASKTCIWIELWSNFRSNELIKVYWWAEGEEKISFLDWWCFVNYPCYLDPSWLRIRPKIKREDHERYAASANEHWYWTIISYTYRSYGDAYANSTHQI